MDPRHLPIMRKVRYFQIFSLSLAVVGFILGLIVGFSVGGWLALCLGLAASLMFIENFKLDQIRKIEKISLEIILKAVKLEHARQLKVISSTLNWSHAESGAAIIEMIQDEIIDFDVPTAYLEVLQERANSLRDKAPDIRGVDFASHSVKLPGSLPFMEEEG